MGGKWGIYLRAPDIFFKLLDRCGSRLVPLGQIAEIRFGVKSGADDFFFVRDVTEDEIHKCSAVYNGIGVVKRHVQPCEPGAGSRAVRRFCFWPDRSSQTLEAAPGSLHAGPGGSPGCFFQGFLLEGFFRRFPTKARLSESKGGTLWFHYSSMRSGDHDSSFKLPAFCREARRPIRPSVPLSAEPPRYSGYRTCEPAADS
jgi:hypothetical protein